MSDDNLFDTSKGLSPADLVSIKGASVDPEDLRRRIKDATPEELNEFEEECVTSGSASTLLLVQTERRSRIESGLRVIADMRHSEIIDRLRVLEKPHWTTTPVFWLTLVAATAAIVGAYFAGVSIQQPRSADTSTPPSSSPMPPPAGLQSPPKNK